MTKNLTDIKINKKVADLVFVYCKLNDVCMSDFVENILAEKFRKFKSRLTPLYDFTVE